MMHHSNASATYIVDSDYTIITYNRAAKQTYPQLKRGEKCHKCLMGLDEPCGPCPIVRGIEGPQTYLDPLRGIHETVDAVEILLEDGSVGHALVLSTTGDREELARQLPRTTEELNRLLEQENYDKLTGGYSRTGFLRALQNHFDVEKDKDECALVLFDVSNFKAINEIFGIDGGDLLLKQIWNRINNSVLAPVLIARLEADRFICLVKRTSLKIAKLDSILNVEWNYKNRQVHVDLKCGIYFPDSQDNISVSSMIDRASIARDSATSSGTRGIAVFDDEMQSKYIGSATILSEFENSLKKEEFIVYYQPLIEAETGRIASAEALIRWKHSTLGLVAPDNFIPILEKNGLISELDQYVIRKVYDLQTRVDVLKENVIPIACNLSWQDFYDTKLMNTIFELQNSCGIPEGMVNYEVTETSFAVMDQNCSYLLDQLRNIGAHVLLDDFGSGYSSFGMIRSYNFDIVKIDRSFIRQIEDNQSTREIISSIVEMSHKLGLKVVAEGVETKLESDFLRNVGCDYLQGYYFAKPMPEEELIRFALSVREKKNGVFDANEGNKLLREREIGKDFLSEILDHTNEFIQVCDAKSYRMLYANENTKALSVDPKRPYRGEICYEYMLGLQAPCAHCPMNQMHGESEKIIEVDDGEHVFALKAKILDWNGKKLFVEYGQDVTATKQTQKRYESQINSILESIPDEQGVFHVDITDDRWFSSSGNAQNARNIQDVQSVDALVRTIGSFVPDEEGQEKFFETFCRQRLIEAHEAGKHEISMDTLSYYDDRSIRWSRITARLLSNPETEHLECVLYGIDISKEREELSRMEQEMEQSIEESSKKAEDAMIRYLQADKDRRTDFLTGLNNRMELYNTLSSLESDEGGMVRAMYMLDLDNFKQINDTHGHLIGDKCLRVVAQKLKAYGDNNELLLFRYGGEEFLVVERKDNKTKKSSAVIAEEMLQVIRGISVEDETGQTIPVTVSIGYTGNENSYEKMINLADQAMYLAKKFGKNRAVCFEKDSFL